MRIINWLHNFLAVISTSFFVFFICKLFMKGLRLIDFHLFIIIHRNASVLADLFGKGKSQSDHCHSSKVISLTLCILYVGQDCVSGASTLHLYAGGASAYRTQAKSAYSNVTQANTTIPVSRLRAHQLDINSA
jgi:hypothetical protein